MSDVVAVIFLISPFILIFLWLRSRSLLKSNRLLLKKCTARREEIETRFASVLDIEKETEKAQLEHDQIEKQIDDLRTSYKDKKTVYDKLTQEVAIFDEKIAMAELGVYNPHFDFEDSETFKAHIGQVRAEQKTKVSAKTALIAGTPWEVGGSKREGKKMSDRAVKLSLRAFNNECEAAISNIRWNNANAMEKRIQRAFEQINKLNESMDIKITDSYFELRLKELWLTHEYREKQKEERDHRAEMSRLKREEDRLLRDAEKAEKEEAKYQKLLDQARKEVEKAIGGDAAELEAQIAELTRELDAAHAKAERAKSMAEKTRAGHIYVISNIGSFGDGIYKIGMTRRLDPMERVRELGDASVPFLFDTHAMVYCEDAPRIEKSLHETFDHQRVNRANGRKEFFKVSLEEIEAEIRKIEPNVDFVTGIEAQEYFETLAMNKAENAVVVEGTDLEQFPNDI